MNQPFKSCYVFGDFRLDAADRQLLRTGTPVLLAPKILDTLLLLVENAGHLVEKDEFMKQLWPGTFVGEDALARNISILRKTLGESTDSQSFIATVPKRGYRFVAPVRKLNESEPLLPEQPGAKHQDFPEKNAANIGNLEPAGLTPREGKTAKDKNSPVEDTHTRETGISRSWPRRIAFGFSVLSVGAFTGLATFYLLSPAPLPRVTRATQLTHSGRVDAWTRIVTDGSRLYFNERYGDHWNLVQTSVAGGDSQPVAAPFPNTVVLDASPDQAELLIGTFERRYASMPLWIWPVQGGAPRRVGDLAAYAAAWGPSGREIIYAQDDGIYMASTNGTNARKFVPWPGRTGDFSWSPDGRFLRFSASSQQLSGFAIWEVHSDGSSLRRLIPGWNYPPDECCGAWAAGDRFFLFGSSHSGSGDIWAIQENSSFLRHRLTDPIRLTSGPTNFDFPLASRDGRKVFVYGNHGQSEFVRYDLKTRNFLPFLPGLRTLALTFSPNGDWLAYVSYEDFTLVRMRPDGSQRLAIAPPGYFAGSPRWSPDGKQIVFEGLRPNRTLTIFLVSPDGGAPREIIPSDLNQFDPMWSPEGKDLVFTREEKAPSGKSPAIFVLHLSTNQLSRLPGSEGLRASSWSPDGRFIAAKSEDEHRLMLFDVQKQTWAQLAQAKLLFGLPWWSKDGKSLYYQDLLAPNEPIYSLHLNNKRQEVVATFEQFLQGSANRAAFLGLLPDGSLMAILTRDDSDIYVLDVDFP